MASKIVVEQNNSLDRKKGIYYVVKKLVNITRPLIGEELTESALIQLRKDARDLTVEIVQSERDKKRR